MKKRAPQHPPKSFEAAMAELEQLLRDLEGENVGLEDSLTKYERGAFLLQHCRGVLSEAEQRIEQLIEKPGGKAGLAAAALPDGESEDDAE
jgi:exodeoxyribonuclease VII small subunit